MTKIMSQRNAQHFAAGKPVLMMNSPNNETSVVKKIKEEAADCLYLIFHDIYCPRPHLVHPEFHHVKQALDWGKDKDLDELICVCQAGISRSSAMAYILNSAARGPREAVKVLNPLVHGPNPAIVSMGAELIGGAECSDFQLDEWKWHHWQRSKSELAKEIMQVYLEFADESIRLHQDSVPLEVID